MSNLVFEKLKQSLGAGEVWRVGIAADFFRIAAAAWPVKVRILKGGRIVGDMDGWQAGDYVRGVDFDAVEVINGSTNQAVTVQIAGGGVGSDRVVGEVSIIDGSAARTEAGIAAMATRMKAPAVGNFGSIMIFNPIGSGKKLELQRFILSSAVANTYSLGWVSATEGIKGAYPTRKKAGSISSQMEIWTHEKATAFVSSELMAVEAAAGIAIDYSMREPVVAKEGFGVIVWSATQGAAFRATFEYLEYQA